MITTSTKKIETQIPGDVQREKTLNYFVLNYEREDSEREDSEDTLSKQYRPVTTAIEKKDEVRRNCVTNTNVLVKLALL